MSKNKTEIIKEILQKEENLWIEYKSFWYWNNSDNSPAIQKGWGELLKDFAALFNTYTNESDSKYLVFGFKEKEKEIIQYDIDTNGKKYTKLVQKN
jgi:hypothetical protein